MDIYCVALLFLTSPVTHHPTMHGAMEILLYYFERYIPSITIFISITIHYILTSQLSLQRCWWWRD